MRSSLHSTSLLKDIFVHLDFKGAPPTFNFLCQLIKFMSLQFKNLITGLVFEFEDMFPFDGHLASIASNKAYSKEEIKELVRLCKSLSIKIVVLVQTIGHLEFVLKRTRFAEWREEPDNVISICTLKPGLIDLITQMINQIVELIGVDNLAYLHIGADEVFNFATCRECKLFAE